MTPTPGTVNYTESCGCGAQLVLEGTVLSPNARDVIEGFRSRHDDCRRPVQTPDEVDDARRRELFDEFWRRRGRGVTGTG